MNTNTPPHDAESPITQKELLLCETQFNALARQHGYTEAVRQMGETHATGRPLKIWQAYQTGHRRKVIGDGHGGGKVNRADLHAQQPLRDLHRETKDGPAA